MDSSTRFVSVIVPTWNMGRFLEPLFESIIRSPFADIVQEVIFVCEKSNDGSEQVIAKLEAQQAGKFPQVRMLQPEQRRGLFVARYAGAKAARATKIMFIDSRITVSERTGRALPELFRKFPAMAAEVDIDVEKNVFCLYWERSHHVFYRARGITANGPVTVSKENFHDIRIGGTCFYCSRDHFVRISEKYLNQGLFSDDTYVMADLVAIEPFTLHPDFRINWEPRDRAKDFLKHLYTRGPGLAEYHFYRHRGGLFYATLGAVIYGLITLALIFVSPLLSLMLVFIALLLMSLSTIRIARSVGEFFRLAPLHVAVMIYYGLGALRGAWVIWKKRSTHALS